VSRGVLFTLLSGTYYCSGSLCQRYASKSDSSKNWDFPKIHWIEHAFDDIEAKGVTRNYNMKPNEKLHGPLKKCYLKTNFKNVAEQVPNHLQPFLSFWNIDYLYFLLCRFLRTIIIVGCALFYARISLNMRRKIEKSKPLGNVIPILMPIHLLVVLHTQVQQTNQEVRHLLRAM